MARDEGQRNQHDDLIEQLPGRSLTDNLKLGGGIAIIAALVIFLLQNLEDADVTFLFWEWTFPLFFALLLAAGLGAIVAWMFTTFRGRAERKRQEALYESAVRDAKRR
jgi:uncharacterized integral membrane protein